ncbi:sensor domain-containing protein [Vibrio algarum]|uniref:EAL domain-containing protein n=1 Tax=Vibrio algarum TaxID=3020714 RepID=A0ABT4YPT6_9VIBR|nr:EAL domain-containing protein [Vibrio sp. KJ40-1]MDB1123513.1 EAL domain-containing protein [Vibrio sp. KJ40-1]
MSNQSTGTYEPNESRFLQLIESMPKVAVQGYDKNRKVIYWNEASCKIYGYTKKEAFGQTLENLIIPSEMKQTVIDLHHAWIEQGIPIPAGELQLKRKDGNHVIVYSTHVMLKQGSENPEMFCVDVDLTEQHQAKLELQRIATTDSLTGLPNRRYFEKELSHRLNEARRFNQKLAVLFIDIDLFKEINDTMGHNAGDRLLIEIAHRLKPKLRKYDTLSRFGSDEFLIILPNIRDSSDVEYVVQKVMSEFEQTYTVFEQEIYVTASIGISLFPKDGDHTDQLLKYSDAAMYKAKKDGRNRHHFFDQSIHDLLQFQREIASNLRHSLELDEFHLVYQPQVDLSNNKIVSCEALLRWDPKPPSIGTTPDIFIPIAERSDLIVRIGEWVLRSACKQIAQWKNQGIEGIRIDINVSGKQLEHNRFFSILYDTLNEFGLQPKNLGIELTEHALIEANSELMVKLERLKKAGVEISIDDFGTGYSSLSYLRQFPINNLKIDRAFVTEAPNDPRDEAVLKAIIDVGHHLDLVIVAEGIETEQQAKFCHRLGSDLAQGFWYHKPIKAKHILPLLLNQVET